MELRYRLAAALSLLLFARPAPGQTPEPSVLACQKAYDSAYEKPYSLPKEIWDDRCGDGLRAGDIAALGQEKCREEYNPKTCEPIGLSREVWDKDCGAGLSGRSSSEYFQAKQKQFVLDSPIEKVTAAQAYAFNFWTKEDASAEVAAKRARLEARLAQSAAAWKGLGSSLTQERDFLAMPLAETESQYRALMERFDRARAAPVNSDLAANAVAGAVGAGSAPDTRPLRLPSRSMRGADRGLDDPEAVKGRLREEVKSIAARRDGKGLPVYEEKAIKIMEMVVESVPVRRGVPPVTDLTALEDARQTIAVISKDQTRVVFDSGLDYYGTTTDERKSDGSSVRTPAGEYKRMIKIRPGVKGKEEYSLEQLAGVFIHEISHVQVFLDGGGASKRVNENAAFLRESRFYSNKRHEFNERIKEVGGDSKRVGELIKRRDSFLSGGHAENLDIFEKDPEDFIYQIIPLYLKIEEFKPGAVTLAQEKELARKEKNQKKLQKLMRDEALDLQSRRQDAEWRQTKRSDCSNFLKQDAESRAIAQEQETLWGRQETGKLRKKQAAKIERRLKELAEANEKILENYEPCRVN